MLMLNNKVGVALLAFFTVAVPSAAASDEGRSGNRKRALLRKSHGNHHDNRRLTGGNKKHDDDITEDVAFWTRMLRKDTGSLPSTKRPTQKPVPRPPTPTDPPVVDPGFGRPPPSDPPVVDPGFGRPSNPPAFPSNPPALNPGTGVPVPTEPPVFQPVPSNPPVFQPVPSNPPVFQPVPTDPPAPAPGGGGDSPVARDDSASMLADEGIAFVSVLENDTPAAGEELTVKAITTVASNGDCTISLDLVEVTYTPNDGFTGTDSCVYEACDTVPACDSATLTITVT